MATQTEPVTTEPTVALFRALRSVDVEPNLAYEAAEEKPPPSRGERHRRIGAQDRLPKRPDRCQISSD